MGRVPPLTFLENENDSSGDKAETQETEKNNRANMLFWSTGNSCESYLCNGIKVRITHHKEYVNDYIFVSFASKKSELNR